MHYSLYTSLWGERGFISHPIAPAQTQGRAEHRFDSDFSACNQPHQNVLYQFFSSRTILPISVHEEGWKLSAQTYKLFPTQLPSPLPAKGSSHLQSCICCVTASIPTLLPPKGMGNGSRDGAQKCADGNVAGEGVGDFDLQFVCSAFRLGMKQCFICGG